MPRSHLGHLVGFAGLMGLIAVPSASAAERFASPIGSGTACTKAAPCDILTAVNDAESGDQITVQPGTYGSPTPLSETLDDGGKTLTIEGHPGPERPVIITQAGYGIELAGDGSSVRGLDIEDSTGDYGIYLVNQKVSADQVIVHVTAPGAIACDSYYLADSVCWASGANGIAITSPVAEEVIAELGNDTLIASGSGGIGVDDSPPSGSRIVMNLVNSIVKGSAADISASTDSNANTVAVVNAVHSDYASVLINDGGGGSTIGVSPAGSAANQTGEPAFVNAPGGDFHELASSLATIGRGLNEPDGLTFDLDGNRRDIGGRTDIGAYQFIPPPTCDSLNEATALGSPLTIELKCVDLGGAPLSYAIVSRPMHGGLSDLLPGGEGEVIYQPQPGYSGPDSFTYDASSAHGTSIAMTVSILVRPAPSPQAPALTDVSESNARWIEGSKLASFSLRRRPPIGTVFAFDLNERAKVSLMFTKSVSGRRVKGKCVGATKRNHNRASCKRTVTRGKLALTGDAGAHEVFFQGRISRTRKLGHGQFTVQLTATNATGQRSATESLAFRIVG